MSKIILDLFAMIGPNSPKKQVQSAMKEDQDDHARSTARPRPGFDTNPFDKHLSDATSQSSVTSDWQDNDTQYFSGMDEDLDPSYEETDRDTDFAPALHDDALDETAQALAFDELLPEDLQSKDDDLFAEQEAFLHNEAGNIIKEEHNDKGHFWSAVDQSDDRWLDDDDSEETRHDRHPTPAKTYDMQNTHEQKTLQPEALWLSATAGMNNDEEEARDDEWYDDEEEYSDEEFESERWPISLIVIGSLALLLVIAGVYGIVQDRSATQDQIRQLQASLATAVSPEEVASSRSALQDANERARELSAQVSSLRSENQRLADTVAGLEAQVAALSSPAKPAADDKPVAPKPAVASKPAPAAPKPAATATSEGWFVNFGSYGDETIARDWANKLSAEFGDVIVAPSAKDGRTYYRVRVVGLSSRDAAEATAKKLESAYGLSRLWVGRQ
ncbi:MAG: SPOR domain-containing protein [Gammaproteobacteria bacterium]|nr:SPOR domain-containing protein [Gammaproteobacteria bacterium]